MIWINVNDELPPINTIVKVRLDNGCETYDYVDYPIDEIVPFKHYIVTAWRNLTDEECKDIVTRLCDNGMRL